MSGSASYLVPRPLTGALQTDAPMHHTFATVVGMATALVRGEADYICSYEKTERDDALGQARAEARRRALDAGAMSRTVQVVETTEMTLDSPHRGAMHVRATATGRIPG